MRRVTLENLWTGVDGVRVYARTAVDDGRTKPAIVLVHGVGLSSRYMVPPAQHLRTNFQVYALDLPGYGRSEKTREASTVLDQTEELRKAHNAHFTRAGKVAELVSAFIPRDVPSLASHRAPAPGP
jgi:pimeloyl-ACP methyl ester carboxylesterase